jgi:hypothetical protein
VRGGRRREVDEVWDLDCGLLGQRAIARAHLREEGLAGSPTRRGDMRRV